MLSQRRLRSLRRRINRLQCESCHVPSRGVVSMWELWDGSGRLIRWKTLESDFHKWQSGATEHAPRSVDAPRGLVRNAEPHWTSRIGTGTAAALEAGKMTTANSTRVRAH